MIIDKFNLILGGKEETLDSFKVDSFNTIMDFVPLSMLVCWQSRVIRSHKRFVTIKMGPHTFTGRCDRYGIARVLEEKIIDRLQIDE